MRIVFMGTPDFSVATLAELINAGHEIVAVYCQPPRPAGRGMAERPSPVQAFAEQQGLEVRCPTSLKGTDEQEAFRALDADAAVVVAYGLILPQAILDAPREGCFNIHASALPRWRGAAPIQRAIMAGDASTAVMIMKMEAGLDTGPICLGETIAIGPDTTASELHDALSQAGADLIVRAMAAVERGSLDATPQPEDGVTYAAKIDKAEAALDWRLPAAQLARCVRAFNPFPGASCAVDGTLLKVWRATAIAGHGQPGEILAAERSAIVVACGEGALRLDELQKPGGKRLAAAQFLVGTPIAAGSRCALPVT